MNKSRKAKGRQLNRRNVPVKLRLSQKAATWLSLQYNRNKYLDRLLRAQYDAAKSIMWHNGYAFSLFDIGEGRYKLYYNHIMVYQNCGPYASKEEAIADIQASLLVDWRSWVLARIVAGGGAGIEVLPEAWNDENFHPALIDDILDNHPEYSDLRTISEGEELILDEANGLLLYIDQHSQEAKIRKVKPNKTDE